MPKRSLDDFAHHNGFGGKGLMRDLVGVTALKILCLALIYALFFGASHRMPLDPVSRIAGSAAAAAATQR